MSSGHGETTGANIGGQISVGNEKASYALELNSATTLLDDAASYFAARVGQRAWSDLQNRARDFPSTFLNGSVCTGTDVFSICVSKVFGQLADFADVASRMVVSFVCEKDVKKTGFSHGPGHGGGQPRVLCL